MKSYVLRTPANRDNAPAFAQRAMTWAKGTNELHGIIRGILVDEEVSEKEAIFLKEWILSRPDLICDPLVSYLATRLVRVCEDGIVTQAESDELKCIFSSYIGNPNEEAPTDLPLDSPAPEITIKGSIFCFTGTFVSGTRAWCHKQIAERGGNFTDRTCPELDYLVIGSKVSKGWINQSYGRKIEEIVSYRNAMMKEERSGLGRSIPRIVAEDHWLKHL